MAVPGLSRQGRCGAGRRRGLRRAAAGRRRRTAAAGARRFARLPVVGRLAEAVAPVARTALVTAHHHAVLRALAHHVVMTHAQCRGEYRPQNHQSRQADGPEAEVFAERLEIALGTMSQIERKIAGDDQYGGRNQRQEVDHVISLALTAARAKWRAAGHCRYIVVRKPFYYGLPRSRPASRRAALHYRSSLYICRSASTG